MMSIDCINLHEAIRVKTDGTCTSCCLQSIPYKDEEHKDLNVRTHTLCLLYTSPSPRDKRQSRMPSSA